MSASRERIIREQLERTIREVIEALPFMKRVFLNPTYDLNKTVENELDFLLGAVLASILERNAIYLLNRQIIPTNEELFWLNNFLFSRAKEFKDLIRKLLEV